MLTRKNPSIQTWFKEGWQEFKIVGLVFLGIVFLGAALLMTPLSKATVIWGSFVAGMLLPPFFLYWGERRKKRSEEVKTSASRAFLLHGQTMVNGRRIAREEDAQSFTNLLQPLGVSQGGSIIPSHVYIINNTGSTLAIVPPIDLNERVSWISGKVGSVENSNMLGGVPRGVLSASKNMTASAQLPAQRLLETASPRSAGIMKPPIPLVAD